jgi:LysR substrate binding domain
VDRLQHSVATLQTSDLRLRQHFHVREAGNSIDQVARHARRKFWPAHKQPHFGDMAREIHGCLSGGIAGRQAVLGTSAYFARAGEPAAPGDLIAHEAVIYDQRGGGAVWTFRREGTEFAVTLKGRLRVTAAEGVRAAVLANAGIAIASEWMFAPEIADGTVKAVLRDWELPGIDLWAVYPAGRTATTKARTFTSFVQEVMHQAAGAGKSA